MSIRLTDFQKRLCNRLQEGLPICARPFEAIAQELDSTEPDVLRETRELKEAGVIRRISPMINQRALGMAGTLVTAHVPQDKLEAVTAAVNGLSGVSHNYLRRHHYNLWFTLQEKSPERIQATLLDLGRRFGLEFHSLPVTHVFKLDVRFDLERDDDVLTHEGFSVPGSDAVALRDEHKQLLSRLHGGPDVTARPFEALQCDACHEDEVLDLLRELVELGVIRRIAAVLNHRKLGYTANVMFAAEVPIDAIVETGQRLARFTVVSHCYERETFEGWPYNLFAMMHARSMRQIHRAVKRFTRQGDVRSCQLLATEAELKKQPVRHKLI